MLFSGTLFVSIPATSGLVRCVWHCLGRLKVVEADSPVKDLSSVSQYLAARYFIRERIAVLTIIHEPSRSKRAVTRSTLPEKKAKKFNKMSTWTTHKGARVPDLTEGRED